MRPFFYEMKRVFTSKIVIILTVTIVLFSAVIAVGSSSSPAGGVTIASNYFGTSYGYGSNDTYHIITHIYNAYGAGIADVNVNVTIGNGTVIKHKTNGEGYSDIIITNRTPAQLADSFYQNLGGPSPFLNQVFVGFNFTLQNGSTVFGESGEIPVHLNQTNPYFFNVTSRITDENGTTQTINTPLSRYIMGPASTVNQPTRTNIMLDYEGNVSSGSPLVKMYYTQINQSLEKTNPVKFYKELNSLNETNMTYYASYSGFSQKIIDPSNLSSNSSYVFALFTPSGTELASASIIVYHSFTTTQVNSQFFGSEMDIMGLFIPLMAVLSGYMTYGKDKTGLVLESVLVRPVSRSNIILSRYVANTVAVFLAALVAFGVSSLIFGYFLGHYLPLNTFLTALFAMLVGISGFIGLVFFASNMLKSQGTLLGAAIGLFFVLDLLWAFIVIPLIPFLVVTEIIRAVPGSDAFARGYIMMFFLSPAGYTNLASYLVQGGSNLFTSQSATIAQIGLNLKTFVIGGVLWIAVPLVMAVVSFVRRD